MTSKQKVFATIEGKETDCFPVTPYNGNFCISVIGCEVSECYTSGKKLAQAQIKAQELTGQDVVNVQSDQYYITEAHGVKTSFSAGSLPNVVSRPITKLTDIAKLKPVDPYTQGRMNVYIEAVEYLSSYYKGEVVVRAPGAGCFPLASHLMGLDEFLLALAFSEMDEDSTKYIFDMLEVLFESHYRFVEACVKAGANIVQCADSLASLDVISPKMYEKYAFPYEKRFFDRINKLKLQYDFYTLLHICGDNTLILEKMAQTGCDIIEFDYKVSMAHCKKTIGDKVCLMGNLNPCGALLHGNPKDVEKEALQAIKEGGKSGRFCLGSGCEVAVNAPLENVKAMVDTGHSMKPDFD